MSHCAKKRTMPSCMQLDVILVAPSKRSLYILLETCKAFSSKYQVKFNPQKIKRLCSIMVDAAKHRSNVFNGQIINAQSHDVHLGNIIGNNTCGLSVQKAKGDLIIKMNVLTSNFRH